MRSPSFRAKNFSTCTRSPTARGSSHASLYVMGRCCLLVSELDRHLGIGPVSQLNTWPVVSPVNASRRPSRVAVHHSGSGRLANPYPMGDFHLLFFASKTGALAAGSKAPFRKSAGHFRRTALRGPFHCLSALRIPDLQTTRHSITWSASASIGGEIASASAFAVLRLMTSSNLVGSCTGRSAGFSPFRIR